MLGRIAEGIIDFVDRVYMNSHLHARLEQASFRREVRQAAKKAQAEQQSGASPFAKDAIERR